MALERREWGNFYGYLVSVKEDGRWSPKARAWPSCRPAQARQQAQRELKPEKKDIGAINHGLERLRLHGRKLELDGKLDAAAQADMDAERAELNSRYKAIEDRLTACTRPSPRQPGGPRWQRPEVEIGLARWSTPSSRTPCPA
jgi:phosphate transport system permease protein